LVDVHLKKNASVPVVVPSDKLSIAELADIFGFPVSALIEAINRNRRSVNKPFYSIPDLAARWNCSRATVYNVLRESESKLFNMSRKGRGKGKWNVPAAVVERIEQSRMEPIPESVAA
jgi:predicted DNA-binding protein YlxM (UPF0122 family)